eukprot:CAMPEP_0170557360 /NCGR_PEP_ID=MMETSP0211-20121228/24396_1 /TAXON_ID=311385 /ORGANISM="Pseudokeronopsis sp., Strain OXSARD2" /LENGTH=85 /DNA_ID=CAMNT_0010868301 /DNA_START=282 /DNA_END=539 /DNA_ORIENTATION=+
MEQFSSTPSTHGLVLYPAQPGGNKVASLSGEGGSEFKSTIKLKGVDDDSEEDEKEEKGQDLIQEVDEEEEEEEEEEKEEAKAPAP